MKPALHIHGALRVEYRVQTHSQSKSTALITSEKRFAGGVGAVALALVACGARVRLSGNPIGTDSHGRFLLSQLQEVPNLELDIAVRDDVVTPYAILIRGEGGDVQTLLSPEASHLEGANDYLGLLDALRTALSNSVDGKERVEKLVSSYDAEFGDLTVWKRLGTGPERFANNP